MQWVQASYYLFQVTKQNKPVVELPDVGSEPTDPILFYDGKAHALLYRNEQTGIILDYLDPRAQTLLKQSETITVCEFDFQKDTVRRLYDVSVHLCNEPFQITLLPAKGEQNDTSDH